MFTKRNVLLPTDFSPYAHHALKYAVAIAKRYEGVVHLVHVLDSALFTTGGGHGLWLPRGDLDTLIASMKEHAASRMEHLVEMIAAEGVEAVAHTECGSPAREIVRASQDHDCDVVVIATHGRSGFDHMVFGSVCEKVVRMSQVPVFSVKHPQHECVGEHGEPIQIKRVLFPCDFSEYSKKGLPYAVSLCGQFEAQLVLLNVCEVPMVMPELMPDATGSLGADMAAYSLDALEKMKEDLTGLDVEVHTLTGVPNREIVHFVDEQGIDLVVIPTHGHSGIAHVLFGGVAEKVVRTARCPVLTVRPTKVPALAVH